MAMTTFNLLSDDISSDPWVQSDKTDEGTEVVEADLDTSHGAAWGNAVCRAIRQANTAFRGTAQVAAFDIATTLDVDGAATFGGNVTLSGASSTFFHGDGTGGPVQKIYKADAERE